MRTQLHGLRQFVSLFSGLNPRSQAVALVVAASVILWFPIFVTPGFQMHGDLALPLNLQRFWDNIWPLWEIHGSFTNIDELDRLVVIVPTLVLASILHITIGKYMEIFLFACFVLSGISSIYLLDELIEEKLLNNSRVAFIAVAILYSCNPWALYRVSAPFFYLTYAVTPLFLLVLRRYLNTGQGGYALTASVLFVLASGSPQYTIFTTLLTLPVFFLNSKASIAKRTQRLAVVFVFMICESAYWILPFVIASRVAVFAPGYTLTWADVIALSRGANLIDTLRGYDQWVRWWSSPIADLAPWNALWYLATVFVPIFAILTLCYGLFYTCRAKKFLIIGTIMVVSYFLSLGAHGPFPLLYRWLIFDAPIVSKVGWILRASEKFGAYLWLSYSLLCGIGIHFLVKKRLQYLAYASTFLFTLSVSAIIQGTLLDKYMPVQLPSDYVKLNSDLSKMPGQDAHILQIADYQAPSAWPSGDLTYKWARNRMAGFVTLRSYPWPSFGYYHFTNPFANFYSFIASEPPEVALQFARIANVRKVVVERDIVGDDAWVRKTVAGMRAKTTISRHEDDFDVFNIANSNPRVMGFKKFVVAIGGSDLLAEVAEDKPSLLLNMPILFAEQDLSVDRRIAAINAASIVLDKNVTTNDAVLALANKQDFIALGPLATSSSAEMGWYYSRISNAFDDARFTPYRAVLNAYKMKDDRAFDFGIGTLATSSSKPICINTSRKNLTWIRARAIAKRTRLMFSTKGESRSFLIDNRQWHWYQIDDSPGRTCFRLKTQESAPIFVGTVVDIPIKEFDLLHRLVASKDISVEKWMRSFHAKDEERNAVPVTATWDSSTNISIVSADPFSLIKLAESYDPFWQAASKTESVRSVPVDYFGNSFMFRQKETKVAVSYVPQEDFNKTLPISAFFFLLPFIATGIGRLRNNA